MPKFGAHILFADLARAKRPDLFPGPVNAMRLGAVGPDFSLFLFDPVGNNPLVRKGFDVTMGILSRLHDIKKDLAKIEAKFKGPADDLLQWVSGGITTDARDIINLGLDAMLLALKLSAAFQTSSINIQNPLLQAYLDPTKIIPLIRDPKLLEKTIKIDALDNFGFPFRYFGHPYTDDGQWKRPTIAGDYSQWWWMDLLHYRLPGSFANRLRELATSPVEKAYAAGYMTHVAGDICGHPFINSLVGGPFRNHAYRHMVLESLADTWLWDNQKRGDIITSDLHALTQLDEGDLRSAMDMVSRAMRSTYKPPMVPKNFGPDGYPSVENLVAACQLMTRYLELSTSGGIARPMPPPDSPEKIFDELQTLLGRNNPGQPPTWNSNDPLAYLMALLNFLYRGVILLAMIATLPVAILNSLAMNGPRWLLYLMKLATYQIVSALRTMLCLLGWGYAGADDFSNFGFLGPMVRSRSYREDYPANTAPLPKLPFYWLVAPQELNSGTEFPSTHVGPIPPDRAPDWMVDPNNRIDTSKAGLLQALYQSKSPAETVMLEWQISANGGTGFGNAVDFSIALLDKQWPVPDFDLDGDRGFAFKEWDTNPASSPTSRYFYIR